MAIREFKEILQKEAIRVDIKDRKIFERGSLPSFFGRGETDTIEFILYDQGDNQLPQGENGKLVRYVNLSDVQNIRKYILIARGKTSNANAQYFVDIEKLINEAGYKNGLYKTQVTLLNKRVGSESEQNKVWIHEISPSRTEIRVLPIKAESDLIREDLEERYNILLRNGEFRDDIINRLDGFIDTISTESVLRKLNNLYGRDWIKNLKREFRIENFEAFIDRCVIKSKEAIGYYVRNREYKITSPNYGRALSVNKFERPGRQRRDPRGRVRKGTAQGFDIADLVRTSNEIICDVINYYLPKRNINTQNVPSLTKLESRDKIEVVLQKFNKSKKIDTDVSVTKRRIKPVKVKKAKIGTLGTIRRSRPKKKDDIRVEKENTKPVIIRPPSKKYYYYSITNIKERRVFGRIRSKRDFKVIKYTQMDGDNVSFTLPDGKSVKICALEGSVKAGKGVRVIKKELCHEDTPIPKFLEPKVRDEVQPKELTKESAEIIKNLDIDGIKENISLDIQPIKFDSEALKKAIKDNLKFPKIEFKSLGAFGDIGIRSGTGGSFLSGNGGIPLFPLKPARSKSKPAPPVRVKLPKPIIPFIPESIRSKPAPKPILRNIRKSSLSKLVRRRPSKPKVIPIIPPIRNVILPKPGRVPFSIGATKSVASKPARKPSRVASVIKPRISGTKRSTTSLFKKRTPIPRGTLTANKGRIGFGRRRRRG